MHTSGQAVYTRHYVTVVLDMSGGVSWMSASVAHVTYQDFWISAEIPMMLTGNSFSATTFTTMAFSYSAAAQAAETKPTEPPKNDAAGPSSDDKTIQHLILDAGPLLSLAPLRHLAKSFHTTPGVLAELRDPKAREHWERLKLAIDIKVEAPSAEAMSKVIAFAKKSGDYAVLSATDMSVVALTYQYEVAVNGDARIRTAPGQRLPPLPGQPQKEEPKEEIADDEEEVEVTAEDVAEDREEKKADDAAEASDEVSRGVEALSTEDKPVVVTTEDKSAEGSETSAPEPATVAKSETEAQVDSDDGEWITPSNVKAHRSKDLGLLPDDKRAAAAPLAAACMTGDYAVQNVLLGMGLGLVGEGGKRISKVRSWVLRCHACFKLCKDSSKRFCPSCGNATLMRTTVTTSAATGKQTIHLKKGFQYHLRGTKYSIPDPKPGRAKGQQKAGSGLILREDQAEWQDAVRKQSRNREKEEKKIARGDASSWMDPDVGILLCAFLFRADVTVDARDHLSRYEWEGKDRHAWYACHRPRKEEPERAQEEAIVLHTTSLTHVP